MIDRLIALLDEAHERLALALFMAAIGLELFADFDDFATVSVLLLACVTLLGQERYRGFSAGPTRLESKGDDE